MVRVVVLSGLPGVGKSVLSRELARRSGLFHLRVDAIEGPFLEKSMDVTSEGYEAMRRLAEENVSLGLGSIIDCVNPWPITREMFTFEHALKVEIICSNTELHRARLESRGTGPTFDEIRDRGYLPWEDADLHLDTAEHSTEDLVTQLINQL